LIFAFLRFPWGVPSILIKMSVTGLGPLTVVARRSLIAAAILLPFALRAQALMPGLRLWTWVLAFTILEIVGPWLLPGCAELRLSSALTGLPIAIVPILTTLVSCALGEEQLSRSILRLPTASGGGDGRAVRASGPARSRCQHCGGHWRRRRIAAWP